MTLTEPQFPAASYARQSHGKTKSIEDQETLAVERASTLNWRLDLRLRDTVGASQFSTGHRDDWEHLIGQIEDGHVSGLIMWESSRGDRDEVSWMRFLRLCKTKGVLLHVINHNRTYDVRLRRDWKTLAEDGIDNADETWKLSERVQRGLSQSAIEGRPHGKTPFGYIRVYHEHNKAFIRQEADDQPRVTTTGRIWDPASLVRQVFDDTLAGVSLTEQCRRLNESCIPVPRLDAAQRIGDMSARVYKGKSQTTASGRWEGSEWRTQILTHILTNHAYLGERWHRNVKTKDQCWPSLVTEDSFERIQSMLSDPKRVTTRTSSAKTLLSCIAECAVCGDNMVSLKARPEARQYSAAYRCRKNHAAISQLDLDGYVERWILWFLTASDRWALVRAERQDTDKRILAAQSRLDDLHDEWSEWIERLKNTDKAKRPKAAALMAAQETLMPQIEEMEAELRRLKLSDILAPFVGATTKRAENIWAGFPLSQKREVLRAVHFRFRVHPAGKGRRNVPVAQRVVIEAI